MVFAVAVVVWVRFVGWVRGGGSNGICGEGDVVEGDVSGGGAVCCIFEVAVILFLCWVCGFVGLWVWDWVG